MKVVMNGRVVEIKPTTLGDYKVLLKFPGLVRQSGKYFCSNKGPVLRNLLKRLSSYGGVSIEVDPSVEPLLKVGRLEEIPDTFKFITDPLKHQHIALRFLLTNRGGGLLLDPGLGKTKICCDYAWLEKFQRVLVICPKPLLFVWQEEIETHRPELSYHVFESTDWEEEYSLAKDKTVWVMNYRKASILVDRLYEQEIDAMFIDEGLVKNISSDQTQDITKLSQRIPIRVIMSGTLVNNSAADIFAPVRIMEPSLVGTSYTNFRDAYLNTWQPDRENKPHMKVVCGAKDPKMLKEILHTCSLVMRKEEWLNLPPKYFHYIEVDLPKKTESMYYELVRNYSLKLSDSEIVVDNPLSMMSKLSQFGGGFLYLDEQTGSEAQGDLLLTNKKTKKPKKRKTLFFDEQPKIEALKKLLDSDLRDKKFLLWYTMDAERVLIEKLLSEKQIEFLTIAGGDKGIKQKVRDFNTDPKIRVLLCQAKTLNYGVTLLGNQGSDPEETDAVIFSVSKAVHTQVFYSLTYSLEVFLQQQDRIHRIGQTKDCHYYIIVARTPTELKLVKALEEKQEIREFMLEDWIHLAQEAA